MTTADRIQPSRSIAGLIGASVERAAERVVPASLFETLLTDKLALVTRTEDGALLGINQFVVFYAPLREWAEAKPSEVIGEWVYGEWSDRRVSKPLDTGLMVEGSRVVLALGRALRAGNGTAIGLYQVAVGLIEDGPGGAAAHFMGAANMSGLRDVSSSCPEQEFYAGVMSFIATRGDRAVPAFYPLKRRPRT